MARPVPRANRWFPRPVWEGASCYIVGGGPSLEGLSWDALRGRNVLGCNAALYLGVEIVPIILFGDAAFLRQHRAALDRYVEQGGQVVSCSPRLQDPPSYVKVMGKVLHGLAPNALGWNGNTGAAAVNMALLLGADPIYLLGFDMQLSPTGRSNFHTAYSVPPNAKAYNRFLRGMDRVAQDLGRMFPDQRVINLEDGTSALTVFPKESLKLHFQEVLQ